eukprot:1180507-Amphidinium_carterae.1
MAKVTILSAQQERGSMFCVSDYDGKNLCMKLVTDACILVISLLICKLCMAKDFEKEFLLNKQPWYRCVATTWQCAIRLQANLSLQGCVLLCLYSSIGFFTCTPVLHRSLFPTIVSNRKVQTGAEIIMSAWISHTAAHLHNTY